MSVPTDIGGAAVIVYALLGDVKPSGRTIHRSSSGVLPPPRALAICKYPDEEGYYLFYCDGHWNVHTDTFHMTEADARSQAEFEFPGVERLWQATH